MGSGNAPTQRSERKAAARRGAELSTQTLLQISSAAGISVWTWDAGSDLIFQVASDADEKARREGVPFAQTMASIHPDDRARVRRTMRRAIRGRKTGSFRFRIPPLDGKVRHFVATYYPVGPHQLRVIVHDVTRAVDAETALRESEDHYHTAVDLNPEVLWLADAEGQIIEFGPRWPEMVGLTGEQTLGTGWTAALHPDDLPRTSEAWAHAQRTGEPIDVEYRLRLKDGSYRWMRARAAPRRDDSGRILRWYGTLGDIHDRKLAEAALRDSEAFARSILEASTMAIEVLDLDGRLIFMNGPGIEIMEVDDFERIRGRPFDSFWPDEVRQTIRDGIAAARNGETVRRTLFGPTARGTPRWWDISISPIRVEGRIVRLLALSRDVTEAKRNEFEVKAGAQRLSEALESTMDSVISVDRDWKITYLNRHALSVFPGAGPFVGRDLREIFGRVDAAPFFRRYEIAMAEQRGIAFEEHMPSTNAWFEVQAYGSPAGLTIFFRDITARHHAQERIAFLARHDGLTGLLNRSQFQGEFDSALASLKSGEILAVLSIDLDDFKLVNDTLGHPAGDALLQEAASRLRRAIGPRDLAARLGGDEFTVLLRIKKPEQAAETAQAILTKLGGTYVLDGESVSSGASIGIALAPRDGMASETLLACADVALYRVKHEKGRDFRFFEPEMDLSLRERRQMKRELGQALQRGQLSLVFQPEVEIGSNRLVGFEALLRWNHPTLGSVSPVVFVPLAEESGLIGEIGRFVLEAACTEAATWPAGISLAVNLSPTQFRSGPSLVQTVASALQRTGLPPGRLELEITESVLLEESTDSISALESFHRMGIRVALDDFGTGYSSLSYLRRFAFDKIKIDRSFIADLPHSDESGAIVRAIIGLGRSLKTRVTAEGVESVDQLMALRAEGCNEAQGYLFSQPLPPNQARALAATGLIVVGPERTARTHQLPPIKDAG